MNDKELEKIGNKIIKALEPFSQEEREKILKAAAILLDVKDVFVKTVVKTVDITDI